MKNSALNMKAELSDISIEFNMDLDYIDGTTRTFDVLFDNFFSDMHVRDRIMNNMDMMDDYICRLRELEYKLNNDLSEINKEISVWNEQLSIM